MRLFEEEDWLLWERFGMCYHAMRINSFLILGEETVPFEQLHKGAKIHSDLQGLSIKLKPVEVLLSHVPMTRVIPDKINRSKMAKTIDWREGNHVVLNSTNGKGVDGWLLLDTEDERKLLLLDQRKREGKNLEQKRLTKYVTKAREVIPPPFENGIVAIGIFSVSGALHKEEIDESVLVVGREEAREYYGLFADYPLVSPFVNVNDPLLLPSWILCCMSGRGTAVLLETANRIWEERKTRNFIDQNDLRARLQLDNAIQFNSFLKFSF